MNLSTPLKGHPRWVIEAGRLVEAQIEAYEWLNARKYNVPRWALIDDILAELWPELLYN